MIVLSNTNAQVLSPGQSITFNTVILHTGCAECYRPNTGVVSLAAKNAIYEIDFHGNIGATTAGDDAQLNIALDASNLMETTMISTTAAAGDLNNVGADTLLKTCARCGSDSITVTNSGTTTVNVASNSVLCVKRVA